MEAVSSSQSTSSLVIMNKFDQRYSGLLLLIIVAAGIFLAGFLVLGVYTFMNFLAQKIRQPGGPDAWRRNKRRRVKRGKTKGTRMKIPQEHDERPIQETSHGKF